MDELVALLRAGMFPVVGSQRQQSRQELRVARLQVVQGAHRLPSPTAPPREAPPRPPHRRRHCAHKAVHAFTTGAVADALAARSSPGPGQRHAAVRPGRHAHVGPLPRRHAYGA
ncbi:hypothetical protein ACH4HG_39520 [Streptomyces coeruleorubidus]|uniref:Uncharacterized protein n=1 Tax=Streptomyces coeruleorubidus TaxID=116188 RepID=A0ABZ0KSZ6_STRC4|nr:hypothetical protein [Streptomyces coeruleorubidus]WOT40545.1 hypothetical protein R5U08_30880 [Streptomyces coeruleorubidus]